MVSKNTLYIYLYIFFLNINFLKIILPMFDLYLYAFSYVIGLLFIAKLKNKYIFLYIFLYFIFYILTSIMSHDRYLTSYISLFLQIIINFSILNMLMKNTLLNRILLLKSLKYSLYFHVAIFLIIVFIGGGGHVLSREFATVSYFGIEINRNSMHPFIIYELLLYFLINYLYFGIYRKYKYDIILIFMVLLLFTLVNSRAALLSGILFLIFVSISKFNKVFFNNFINIIMIFLVFFILLEQDILTIFFNQFSELETIDSSRLQIILCYISKFDLNHLLYGINYQGDDTCMLLSRVGKNPHNSYIWAMSVYGLLGFFIFILACINLVYLFFKDKFLFILFLILFFSSNTERAFLVSSFEIIYFLFFYISYKIYKKHYI